MNFIAVKQAIVGILGNAAAGRFQTIGYQQQTQTVDEDCNRSVQTFYSSGQFSKRGGRISGPVQHDCIFRIELTVSKAATGDLSVLNDPVSSPEQIAIAISDFQEASELADNAMDELFMIVFQILMDARNIDLGLEPGIITGKWIDNFRKDNPVPRGEYVTLTGSAELSLRTTEAVTGDTGVPGSIIDVTTNIKDDLGNNAGTFNN